VWCAESPRREPSVRRSAFEGRFGAEKGRFANKIEQKSTFFDTDFEAFVLIIKELSEICTENSAAKSLFI
jgi:hypothetical protein